MKAGWKTRIDERRYFEEKKQEWRKRCLQIQSKEAQVAFQKILHEQCKDEQGNFVRPTA